MILVNGLSNFSFSVYELANNAFREHYASAHRGLSVSLSDICFKFFNLFPRKLVVMFRYRDSIEV